MGEIDKALLLIEFKANPFIRKCCLCSNNADDLYIVEFEEAKGEKFAYTWPTCSDCREVMGDQFAEWIPMFCVECSSAGWSERIINMPGTAHAGFVEGCYNCTGYAKKGWWL